MEKTAEIRNILLGNFAENEVVRLKNIERMINQVCVLVQNNLLEKMEQESDKKHRR